MADSARERARERATVEAERVWVNARGYYRAGYMNGWDARDAPAREEAEETLTLSDAAKALEDRLKDERVVADSEGEDWPGRMFAAHSARQEAEHAFFAALARWRGRRNA